MGTFESGLTRHSESFNCTRFAGRISQQVKGENLVWKKHAEKQLQCKEKLEEACSHNMPPLKWVLLQTDRKGHFCGPLGHCYCRSAVAPEAKCITWRCGTGSSGCTRGFPVLNRKSRVWPSHQAGSGAGIASHPVTPAGSLHCPLAAPFLMEKAEHYKPTQVTEQHAECIGGSWFRGGPTHKSRAWNVGPKLLDCPVLDPHFHFLHVSPVLSLLLMYTLALSILIHDIPVPEKRAIISSVQTPTSFLWCKSLPHHYATSARQNLVLNPRHYIGAEAMTHRLINRNWMKLSMGN